MKYLVDVSCHLLIICGFVANMVFDTFRMSWQVPQLKSRIRGDKHAQSGSLPIDFIN